MKKTLSYIAIIICVIQQSLAQNLVPVPLHVTKPDSAKPLVWKNIGSITSPENLANEREHLIRILHERADISKLNSDGTAQIILSIDTTLTDDEAYTLRLDQHGVRIAGKTSAGVFYGLMTMEQLMIDNHASAVCIATPAIDISDAPRTHVRELMVDPCRIFLPYERLKEIIPEMARYKMNSIHLHLVDDQAWRIEIKAYPRLISESSSRTGMDDMLMPISGYYTQEQMKDFVPAYVGCGGTEIDGIDYCLAKKVFRKFEALNISYIRDEIDGLVQQLDNLFGKENMNECKEYVRMLQKMM